MGRPRGAVDDSAEAGGGDCFSTGIQVHEVEELHTWPGVEMLSA